MHSKGRRTRHLWISVCFATVCCLRLSQDSTAAESEPRARGTQESSAQAPTRLLQARELFQKASTLIEQDRIAEALPLLRQAAKLQPEAGRIHHYLGYALWKQRQLTEAKVEFEIALKAEPENIYTMYFLGRIAQANGNFDRARQHYEALLSTGDAIYDTHHRLSQVYLQLGYLDQALEMAQKGLQASPWDSALYFQQGRVLQRMGRTQAAKDAFDVAQRLKATDQALIQKVLSLTVALRGGDAAGAEQLRTELIAEAAHDPEILLSVGIALGEANRYVEALEPLERAATIRPEFFEAHYNLGLTLLKLGRAAEAEASLQKALQIRQDSFETNSALASLYVEQDRGQEAIERLRAADRSRPGNATVVSLLGQLYLQSWYLEEAKQTLQDAIRLKPNDPKLRYLLIEAHQRSKDYEMALQTAQESLAKFPSESRAHFEVGRQLANMGRYQEASAYFEKSIQLEPSFSQAHVGLGDVRLRKGENIAALESYQRARTLDPNDLAARRGLAQTLLRLGRYEEARDGLEESIREHPDDPELYFLLSQAYSRLNDREKAAQAASTFQKMRATEVEKLERERPRKFVERR